MQEPLHQDLLDPWLGPWLKGFPHGAAPLRRSQVAAQGWNVWRGDLPLPLAVIGHEGGTLLVVLNGLRLLNDPIRRGRNPA